MSEVTRWEAVHLKDGDSNIRYQDGTGPDMVKASDYDRLKAECERLETALTTALVVIQKDRKQLDEEQQRRFEGNRLASEEYHTDMLELRKQLDEARELLTRYRKETPIGYQPHMIAHLADAWLESCK